MTSASPTGALPAVLSETPWAILPSTLREIIAYMEGPGRGLDIGALDAQARAAAGRGRATHVLPLIGVLTQRPSFFQTLFFGGTSTQAFAATFRQAINDPGIARVVIDVDSPGGGVSGVEELASEIFKARGRKPIIAVANSIAASAAYWIGSAADEFVVTPGGQVGSIGVFAVHTEFSKMDARLGIKTTLISAGKHKTDGNEFEPLDDEAREAIEEVVDDFFDLFVNAVAKHRGVSTSEVRNGFGEGRMVTARNAVNLGMADRVATLEDVLRGDSTPRRGATAQAAAPFAEDDDADFRRRRQRQRERTLDPADKGLSDDDRRRRFRFLSRS